MEFETAVCTQITIQNTILPSNIHSENNQVSHFCWDNFDINEQTSSGSGTTHSTHGIVIQQVNANTVPMESNISIPKTKQRSVKYIETPLPHCYSTKRNEPSPVDYSTTIQPNNAATNQELLFHTVWTVARAIFNKGHTVPDWAGWISKTAPMSSVTSQSVIGYMAPILHPITDYATVQQCLVLSQNATKSLGQQYTFVTMDLAAAKIAYDITWQKQDEFSNVVVHLGAFHTMCSYMGALGKMMAGSGFEDILIESGICASGSVEKVLSGKHYNRALRVHQHMSDAIERMLLHEFCESKKLSTSTQDDFNEMHSQLQLQDLEILANDPNFINLTSVLTNTECISFFNDFNEYKCQVRKGLLGKTAQFWISYSDSVQILMQFQHAVKENNLDLYITSLRHLCGLLFSADHVNYARYLPLYFMKLLNLPQTHPGAEELLRNGGFSASRSYVPGCRNAIDLTIEQTINRYAKSRGGIIGFSRNARCLLSMVHDKAQTNNLCRSDI